jgi:hypothetical protein
MFKTYQKSLAEDRKMRAYFRTHPRSPRAVRLETLCQILRYAYYSPEHQVQLVDDKTYDYLESEAIPLVGKWSPLHLPGSALKSTYHELTITLAEKAIAGDRAYIDHLLTEVEELC